MKQILTILSVAMIAISVVSCKKDDTTTTPTTTTTSSTTPTDMEYYIQYNDGGKTIKMEANPFATSSFLVINYPNVNAGSSIHGPKYQESGSLDIVFPVDSSNVNKVTLNKKYITGKLSEEPSDSGMFYISDGNIGKLTYDMTFTTGTDRMVDQDVTTTYYNIIKSVKYLKSGYDGALQKKVSYYVVTGEFNISVKNDVTNLTRDLTNGSYKIRVETLAK